MCRGRQLQGPPLEHERGLDLHLMFSSTVTSLRGGKAQAGMTDDKMTVCPCLWCPCLWYLPFGAVC